MKTILIAHNYTQNSFAFMSYSLAHHLASKGNRVVFISHKPFFKEPFFEDLTKGELIVYSWPTENRPTTLKDVLWFMKIYQRYKPNAVISHFVSVNITVSISKIMSLSRVKTLPYYHTLSSQILIDTRGSRFRLVFNKLRKKMLYRFFCDAVICPSNLAKQDLHNYFGIGKGVKILNPLEDRFSEKDMLPEDAIQIVYLGRIDNSKGVLDMAQAFNTYCLQFSETKIQIAIAGSGSKKEELIKLISGNDRINYVEALKYSQVDNYLNKAHYTIIPSKFDALNMVGVESLMNQTPLLVSKTTGLSDELINGHECYMFDSDINSMIELFKKVEKTIHLQKQMSINARNTFQEKFNIEAYFQSIEKLIY